MNMRSDSVSMGYHPSSPPQLMRMSTQAMDTYLMSDDRFRTTFMYNLPFMNIQECKILSSTLREDTIDTQLKGYVSQAKEWKSNKLVETLMEIQVFRSRWYLEHSLQEVSLKESQHHRHQESYERQGESSRSSKSHHPHLE
jgi:hypothetical protein